MKPAYCSWLLLLAAIQRVAHRIGLAFRLVFAYNIPAMILACAPDSNVFPARPDFWENAAGGDPDAIPTQIPRPARDYPDPIPI
jgi:hypothetical protein